MDVSELLDGTDPIEVELAGKTVICEVYTAGWAVRATLDQLADIEPIRETMGVLETRKGEIEAELKQEVPEDRRPTLERELEAVRKAHLKAAARFATVVVPLIVKTAEIDGEPFIYNGEPFADCAGKLPAAFLMAIVSKSEDVRANPTTPDLSESGSGLTAVPEADQIEGMPALSDSQLPAIG